LVILFVKENGRNSGVCMGFENGEEMRKMWVFWDCFCYDSDSSSLGCAVAMNRGIYSLVLG
jgi:hypothetical protein